MEWVASTLHTTSERGVSSITIADVHNSPASSRLNGRPRRFRWTRPFLRKTKSGFCLCAVTFQTQSMADTNSLAVLPYSKGRTSTVITAAIVFFRSHSNYSHGPRWLKS